MKRLPPIVVIAAVLLAAAVSAAGASAAVSPLQPSALAHWRPPATMPVMAFGGSPPQPTAELRFKPVTVTINDVDYRMRVDVFAFITQVGSFAFIDVELGRGAVGSAIQTHGYSLFPANPITFNVARRTLASAVLDSGTELAPDAFVASFTASAAQKRVACTLTNGRAGYRRSAPGTVNWSQFSLDTGTSPFFGTLSNGPVNAKLIWDPGCRGPRRHHRRGLPACRVREVVNAQNAAGSTAFGFLENYARTQTLEGVFNVQEPTDVESVSHFSIAAAPAGDLPPPRHSLTGATAHLRTTGAPFLTGSATFTSSRAPRISDVHRCRAKGSIHRFRSLRYRGRLTPDATPLTAPFDTGDLPLLAMPATLFVRRYLS